MGLYTYTIQGAFLMGLYAEGRGAYTRGNNTISNFSLAISTFLVM